mgnify:CR=1 FL=1
MQYRPSTIASSISNQFPEHYRDDGPDFVEFVKTYYEYLDGANDRNFSKLRDIDSTLEGFLKYYKKKYLHNLPFVEESVADIPFLVKNIGDLYRSKGTSEGLELLFKMFYKTEVETYYPASSILSLSDSKWAFSTFIEFIPVQDVSTFPLQRGDVIEGDTSKATAFIDEIVFYNISGVLTPVGYISNVYGKFTNDDGLRVDRNGVVSYPGKLIYGSISDSRVLSLDATANNKVGDKVKLISGQTGVDAIGQVRAVSDIPTGVVDWQLKDGGWGYAIPAGSTESNGIYTIGQNSVDTENTIYKSTQVLIVQGNEISMWGKNVYVKVPIINTKSKFTGKVINELNGKNIKLNITAVYTANQTKKILRVINKKTKVIISIFAGRASDTGKDPVPEFIKSIKLAKKFKNVEILWASVREPYNYLQAKQLGCHIITIPPAVIEKIEKFGKSFNQLTIETVKAFLVDSKKSNFKI